MAATEGKRFAVIADEAHSSQSGQAAAKLKQVLSAEEQMELADGGEISTEDVLAAQMAAKASDAGITYVAFTATPKAKTLELFGRVPDPSKPKGKEYDQKQVEHAQAMKGLMRWVRLHPYNIAQKVRIVVEHFRETVSPLLNGHAKAMVVTGYVHARFRQ